MGDVFSQWSLTFRDAAVDDAYRMTAFTIQNPTTVGTLCHLALIILTILILRPLNQKVMLCAFMTMGYLMRVPKHAIAYRIRFFFLMMLRLSATMLCVNTLLSESEHMSVLVWCLLISVFPLYICPQVFFPLPFGFEVGTQIVMTMTAAVSCIMALNKGVTFEPQTESIQPWIQLFSAVYHDEVHSEVMVLMFVLVGLGSLPSCLTTYVRDAKRRAEFWNSRSAENHVEVVELVQEAGFRSLCIWIGFYHFWFLFLAMIVPILKTQDERD